MPTYRLKAKQGKHYPRGSKAAMPPGTTVEAPSLEFFGAAKDKFELVSEEPTPPELPRLKLVMVRVGAGRYNIVNEVTKRTLNSAPLAKEEAEKLIEAVAGGGVEVDVRDKAKEEELAVEEAEKDEGPGPAARTGSGRPPTVTKTAASTGGGTRTGRSQ